MERASCRSLCLLPVLMAGCRVHSIVASGSSQSASGPQWLLRVPLHAAPLLPKWLESCRMSEQHEVSRVLGSDARGGVRTHAQVPGARVAHAGLVALAGRFLRVVARPRWASGRQKCSFRSILACPIRRDGRRPLLARGGHARLCGERAISR